MTQSTQSQKSSKIKWGKALLNLTIISVSVLILFYSQMNRKLQTTPPVQTSSQTQTAPAQSPAPATEAKTDDHNKIESGQTEIKTLADQLTQTSSTLPALPIQHWVQNNGLPVYF